QSAMEISAGVEKYCQAAGVVSEHLIAGETGIDFPTAVTKMQDLQISMEKKVHEAFAFDRTELVHVFNRIDQIQVRSLQIQVAISMVCLILALVLSMLVVRGVLRSVSDLSVGLRRFGQGDFDEPIPVSSRDELGNVAEEANRMATRTKGLMRELDSFSYSIAHDLRAPIRGILGFTTICLEDHGANLSKEAMALLNRIIGSANKMSAMVDSLLELSRLSRAEIKMNVVNLTSIAEEVFADLRALHPDRNVLTTVSPGLETRGDSSLLRIVLVNLLGNAWKFTSKNPTARVEVGAESGPKGMIYFVRDNGAGFDMRHVDRLFGTFQRLHRKSEFEGTGIGLATVQTIITKHGGQIWAESKVNEGTVFYFTLDKDGSSLAKISSLAEVRREKRLLEEEDSNK
ncbi:MAG: ATP-binding protein, partial [Bdellovibrionia bacterium]